MMMGSGLLSGLDPETSREKERLGPVRAVQCLTASSRFGINRGMSGPTVAAGGGRGVPLLRWAGLGAIAYVVLFIVGFLVGHAGQPKASAAPEKVSAYYHQSGHRDRIHLGLILILLGVFFFLWFLSGLRQVVRGLAGDGFLTTAVTVGGAVYAALTAAAFAVDDALRTMSGDTYQHTVYPELIHAANDTVYVLHSAGGAGIAVTIVAASLAALAARALPAWLCWLSVVAGISGIVSIFFIPWFIIALWLVIAGVLVFRMHADDAQPRIPAA
jgi:hypothetical protein